MKQSKVYFTLLIITLSISVFCQEDQGRNVYFDENMKPIDQVDYLRKAASFLYFDKKIKKDSITIHKLNQFYKFGQLTEIETLQLRLLIQNRTNVVIDEKQTLIITLMDTLYGYKPLRKLLDSTAILHNHKHTLSKTKYKQSRKKNDKQQKKCAQSFEKYNTKALYFYRYNKQYSYTPESYSWHKIPKAIDALFFNGEHSSMLMLKPNGQYFYYHSVPENMIKKLLQTNWKSYIDDYKYTIQNLPMNRNGVFIELEWQNSSRKFVLNSNSDRRLSYGYSPRNIGYSDRKNSGDVIRVNYRSDIDRYSETPPKCFSYGSY